MLQEAIQTLLKRHKKTQKELCESIGISDTGIRKIYARDSCELSLLKKISLFFNVPMSYFLGEGNCSAHASGTYSAASVHGNASVSSDGEALLKERIKSLEQLVDEKDKMIEEKERTIKILMDK